LDYLQQDGDEATGYLQLMAHLEAAWRQVCPGGPAEDDDGAVITFLALVKTYEHRGRMFAPADARVEVWQDGETI